MIAPDDGDQYLIGYGTDDVMAGGLGNDRMDGGLGDDTYLFNPGDGRDEIHDVGGTDRLVFGAGISADALILSRADSGYRDLVVAFDGSTDRVVIHNAFLDDGSRRIESFNFADGTVWDWDTIKVRQLDAKDVGQTMVGYETDDLLDAGGGNDFIGGLDGDDVIIAGLGNDTLEGHGGSDTYIFNIGDGSDRVRDWGDGVDTLAFGAGINPDDIVVWRQGSGKRDVVFDITGTDDRVTSLYQMQNLGFDGLDRISFADGTVWTVEDLWLKLLAPTDADQHLLGYGTDDILGRGKGNDLLEGYGGSDTYVFNLGDGQDRVRDWGDGVDTLAFGAGINPRRHRRLAHGVLRARCRL